MRASLQRPGIAEVVYVRRDDALRAVDVYHNRQLDGLLCTAAWELYLNPDVRLLLFQLSQGKTKLGPSPFDFIFTRLYWINFRTPVNNGKSNIAPDIGTIHKALFNKNASRNSQIFTVTLPKKDT